MTNLFPQMDLVSAPYRGYQEANMLGERAMQEAAASRLAQLRNEQQQLAIDETRANLPLKAVERDVAMGGAQGALARQPYEVSRQLELAQGGARRAPAENVVLDQDVDTKQRLNALKKQADEMDLFVQAFGPLMEATAAGNFAAANDAWQSGFDLLEKNNIPQLAQLKSVPREQLLPNLRQKYQQALQTAPVLRKKWEDDRNHQQALEIERERTKRAQSVASTRTGADRPVNTTDAAGARLLEKYNKDPNSLTQENRETLRVHLENSVIRLDPDIQDDWAENARRLLKEERLERTAARNPMSTAEYAKKLSQYTHIFRQEHMKRVLGSAYPKLYNPVERPGAGGEERRTLNGKNYIKRDGKWYLE